MKTFDITKLKRNPEAIKKGIMKTSESQIITKVETSILIPRRFLDKGLTIMDDTVKTVGIYCIIQGNNYSVCNAPVMMELTPYNNRNVDIGGVEYIELLFDENSLLIANTILVREEHFIFNMLDELKLNGNVPWFFTPEDLGKSLSLAGKYAGSKIGENIAIAEVLASAISKLATDASKEYRHSIHKDSDKLSVGVTYIGMSDILHSTSNTVNKIVGSYFKKGVIGGLTEEVEEVYPIESILRA